MHFELHQRYLLPVTLQLFIRPLGIRNKTGLIVIDGVWRVTVLLYPTEPLVYVASSPVAHFSQLQ